MVDGRRNRNGICFKLSIYLKSIFMLSETQRIRIKEALLSSVSNGLKIFI